MQLLSIYSLLIRYNVYHINIRTYKPFRFFPERLYHQLVNLSTAKYA